MTDHNNASKTSDEEEFVERLEKGSLAYISESGPVYNGPTWAESKAAEIIKRLVAERDDYKEAYDDTKRLARLIYVALCGEDGAAKQASLCDLVSVAKITRARAEAAEKRIAELKVTLNRVSADRDRWYKAARLLEAGLQQAREGE